MEERFDLAPWELAPDSPEQLEGVAGGRVRTEWGGKEREFLLREVEIASKQFVVFARDVNSTEDGNWMFYDSSGWAGVSAGCARSPNAMNLFSRTQGCNLGRIFHFSFAPFGTNERGFVFVAPDGQAHLRCVQPDNQDPWLMADLFFFVSIEGLEDATAAEWRTRVEQELGDPLSQARFALQWRLLSFNQQADLAIACLCGSHSEMQRLFRAALRCESLLQQVEGTWQWAYQMGEQDYVYLAVLNANGLPIGDFEMSPFLIEWRDSLLKWFDPSFDEDLSRNHRCVLDWSDNHEVFAVSVESPTHHERLEAMLELRDWARSKVPDELLKTLL